MYVLARQSFWIGAVEYVIRGVVSFGCEGVGGIVNGGDDEMGEEGQNGRSDAMTIIMFVSKSTKANYRRGHTRDPLGNMHLRAFFLLAARD